MSDIWYLVDELLDRYDGDVHIDVASEACWGGQLRVTLTNPDAAPSRSLTFYSVAHDNPESVARALLDDFERWHAESGIEPLGLPGYGPGAS